MYRGKVSNGKCGGFHQIKTSIKLIIYHIFNEYDFHVKFHPVKQKKQYGELY